jgi:hypothetical protein
MTNERRATFESSIIQFAAKLEQRSRSAAVGVRRWARYLGFLRIILGRYDEANAPYVELMNNRLELRGQGMAQPSFPRTPDESDQLDRERSLEARIELAHIQNFGRIDCIGHLSSPFDLTTGIIQAGAARFSDIALVVM